jgi:hypothetical protein
MMLRPLVALGFMLFFGAGASSDGAAWTVRASTL